jgi:16S rRNA (adenine1518-N6/adenine1519-N6)-dimethyltransferase
MPPLSPSATRALLAELGHKPRHFLGQSFLVDGNIVRKSLALAGVGSGDSVVEVGPGLGTLTTALLEAGAEVWAVEKDPRLHAHLAASLQLKYPATLHLLAGDAIEHPLAGLTAASFKIVANPPYAISTPWLDAVLGGPLPDRMVLMLQLEAARRYAAEPGSKAFGSISVFLQAAYDIAPGHQVSAGCFHPEPDVESCLLNLVRKPVPVVFEPAAKALIRSCFQRRRKQIGALVRGRLGAGEARWLEHLRSVGLSEKTRPEAIPVSAWIELSTLVPSAA